LFETIQRRHGFTCICVRFWTAVGKLQTQYPNTSGGTAGGAGRSFAAPREAHPYLGEVAGALVHQAVHVEQKFVGPVGGWQAEVLGTAGTDAVLAATFQRLFKWHYVVIFGIKYSMKSNAIIDEYQTLIYLQLFIKQTAQWNGKFAETLNIFSPRNDWLL